MSGVLVKNSHKSLLKTFQAAYRLIEIEQA